MRASDPHVAEAASTLLPKASAVDLVVCGVLVAAALVPSVLLGPVQLLVGGAGMGLRAIDGRTRQPGKGAPRPRGFQDDDPVPPAAFVAVPVLPAALAAALATTPTEVTLARLVAPAVAVAKSEGAKARADLLARIGRHGAKAMAERAVAAELVAAAGRLAGGILTEEDLAAATAAIEACAIDEGPRGVKRRVARAPWEAEGATLAETRIVAAADGRGRVAVACYEAAEIGVEIPGLECTAPPTAEPVRRGTTRVRPGDPRPACAPIALLEAEGALQAALGFGGQIAQKPLAAALSAFLEGQAVDMAAHATPGAVPVGVVRTRDGARGV